MTPDPLAQFLENKRAFLTLVHSDIIDGLGIITTTIEFEPFEEDDD